VTRGGTEGAVKAVMATDGQASCGR
jgi:hypothetical protein